MQINNNALLIRDYKQSDAYALTHIFYDTIHSIGLEKYTPEQVEVWAPRPINYEFWQTRLNDTPPYVAELNGLIVGFITLTDAAHIEWTYTHKAHQGQGIASRLYDHLETEARLRGYKRLTVNASHFAKVFFAKQGFDVERQTDVEKGGQRLANWLMAKVLG